MTEAPPQPAPTADDLRGPLLDYLRRHTQDPTLSYRDPLQLLADGSTARIFRFRLAGTQGSLARPLVLRILLDSRQAALIAFESAVQSSLASIGYPAPAVLAHHGTGELLGSPFMIMERAPGITLGAVLAGLSLGLPALVLIGALPWPTALLPLPIYCAIAVGPQLALHELPIDELQDELRNRGVDPGRLSRRHRLETLATTIDELKLPGLGPVVDWLRTNPLLHEPGTCFCHGDYWAGNVLIDATGRRTVIDWTNSIVAHPELDHAWNEVQRHLVLPKQLPFRGRTRFWWDEACRPLVRVGVWYYRTFYTAFKRLDRERLDYYFVLHALFILVSVAARRASGAPGRGPLPFDPFDSGTTVDRLLDSIAKITGNRPDF